MLPDDGFLGQLRDCPGDDTLRLVYADWLDDRCDPRGEYLRVELRMLDLPEDGDEYRSLKARLAELAAGIDVRWRAAVGRVHVEPGPPFANPWRHALNVAGPFYTIGECPWCAAPETVASDLLAPRGNSIVHHFVRQPATAEEIGRACSACQACSLRDLRYGGTDPLVIRRLGNMSEFCDHLIRDDSPTLVPAHADLPAQTMEPAPTLPALAPPEPSIHPALTFARLPGERPSHRWLRWFTLGMGWGLAIVVPIGALVTLLAVCAYTWNSSNINPTSILVTLLAGCVYVYLLKRQRQ